MKGGFATATTVDGCRLRQGTAYDFFLPQGTRAEYLGTTFFAVEIEGRFVEFQLADSNRYGARLAKDVVAFLTGEGGPPRPQAYSLEWYLLVPALLPLGIPVAALGGTVPITLGVVLTVVNLLIARIEAWPRAARAVCCWCISGAAYVLLGALVLVAVIVQQRLPRPAAPPPGGGPVAVAPSPHPPAANRFPNPVNRPPPAFNPPQPEPAGRLMTLKASSVVDSLAFSPDGQTLATGDGYFGPGRVKLWDQGTGQEVKDLPGYNEQVFAVAFSPDGKWFATGSGEAVGRLWDAKTWQLQFSTPRQPSYVRGVAFSPDSHTLATVCDGALRLWDVDSRKEKKILVGHEGIPAWKVPVTIGFSPDGATLVAGSGEKDVKLWDVETGQPPGTLTGHQGIVLCATFSPNGKLIASGGFDKAARIWDAKTLKPVAICQGHDGWVNTLAFSPDSRWLATGSGDKTVRLSEAATGKPAAVVACHDQVVSVAFSPDGRKLATGGKDNTAEIWDVAQILSGAGR